MIEPHHGVPVRAILRDGEVQVRPRRKHASAVRVVDLALQAEEEVRLVLDDRTADHAAPIPLGRGRLGQILRLDEVVLGDPGVVREGAEHHALELVGAGLRHGVDHGAARPAELGVVHARQHLELLDRLQRRPHLRARARPQGIVGVIAAVDRDVVVLGGLAGGNDGVVAHLVGGRELDARQQRHGREVITVHRRQLGQFGGADVASDANRRGVDERRFTRHRDRLLEAADHERQGDGEGRAHLHDETALLGRTKPGERRRHPVAARHDLRHTEGAFGSAHRLAEDTRRLIGDDNGGARQSTTLLVRDTAGDVRSSLLGI